MIAEFRCLLQNVLIIWQMFSSGNTNTIEHKLERMKGFFFHLLHSSPCILYGMSSLCVQSPLFSVLRYRYSALKHKIDFITARPFDKMPRVSIRHITQNFDENDRYKYSPFLFSGTHVCQNSFNLCLTPFFAPRQKRRNFTCCYGSIELA